MGLLVPLAGVYASLGEDMRAGWELWLAENGGKLGGREVETVVADEGDGPETAIPALQKLLQRDKVDAVVGIVSSAVALGAQDLVNRSKKLLIIANAGANGITGEGTSNYIWRTSFTNSQVAFAMGQHLAKSGDAKRVYTIAPDYAAGAESVAGFVSAYKEGGGKSAGNAKPPFQTTSDYEPYLSRIRRSNADGTYCFFAGSEAVNFVKQYGQFGLSDRIPLFGAGFLTEGGVLKAQGKAAEGVQTALHYAASLDNEANTAFAEAYQSQDEAAAHRLRHADLGRGRGAQPRRQGGGGRPQRRRAGRRVGEDRPDRQQPARAMELRAAQPEAVDVPARGLGRRE